MPQAYRVNYRSAINKLTQTTCDNVDCDDANKLRAFSCRLSRVCWQLYARLPTVARVSLTAVRSTVVTSLVGWSLVGHVRALWLNGVSEVCCYCWTLIGNPTQRVQWYHIQPPTVTPNLGSWPHLWNSCVFPRISQRSVPLFTWNEIHYSAGTSVTLTLRWLRCLQCGHVCLECTLIAESAKIFSGQRVPSTFGLRSRSDRLKSSRASQHFHLTIFYQQ